MSHAHKNANKHLIIIQSRRAIAYHICITHTNIQIRSKWNWNFLI